MKIDIDKIQVNKLIQGELYVVDAAVRKTKTAKPSNFLTITFSDGVNTIEGKLWQYPAEVPIPAKKVYSVTAVVGEYMGTKQLTIQDMSKLVEAPDQSLFDFRTIFCSDTDMLKTRLAEYAYLINNTKIRDLVLSIYTDCDAKLAGASAAKNFHHAGVGGLLFHTYEVCSFAYSIYQTYLTVGLTNKDKPYSAISGDLIIAGALLHDIGKVDAYDTSEAAVEMTFDGTLLDHIVIGIRMIYEAAARFGPEYGPIADLLAHMIASHHGTHEAGSPVTPKFLEAYILNIADGLSATVDQVRNANAQATQNSKKIFTDRVFALGNLPLIQQGFLYDIVKEGDKEDGAENKENL